MDAEPVAAPAPELPATSLKDAKPARSLGPLRMIWQAALAYPTQLMLAGFALLVTAAATLAIPAGFRKILDQGFAAGGDPSDIGKWFRLLLLVVGVLALGTALRFYFV